MNDEEDIIITVMMMRCNFPFSTQSSKTSNFTDSPWYGIVGA